MPNAPLAGAAFTAPPLTHVVASGPASESEVTIAAGVIAVAFVNLDGNYRGRRFLNMPPLDFTGAEVPIGLALPRPGQGRNRWTFTLADAASGQNFRVDLDYTNEGALHATAYGTGGGASQLLSYPDGAGTVTAHRWKISGTAQAPRLHLALFYDGAWHAGARDGEFDYFDATSLVTAGGWDGSQLVLTPEPSQSGYWNGTLSVGPINDNTAGPPSAVTGLTFAAPSLVLAMGGVKRTNAATVQVSSGQPPAPSYSSATPAVATVDAATGEVTPVAPGTAVITASAGGQSASYTAAVGTLTSFALGPKPGPVVAEGAAQNFMVSQTGSVPAGLFDVVVQGGDYELLDATTIRVEKNGDPVYSVTVTSKLRPSLHDTVIGTLPGIVPEPVLVAKHGAQTLASGAQLPVTLQAGTGVKQLFLGIGNGMPGADTEALVGLAVQVVGGPSSWASASLDSPTPFALCTVALTPPSAVGALATVTLRFTSTRAGVAPFDLVLVPTVVAAAAASDFTTADAARIVELGGDVVQLLQMVTNLYNNAVPKAAIVQDTANEVETRQLGVKPESVTVIAGATRTGLQPDVQAVGAKADEAKGAALAAGTKADDAKAAAQAAGTAAGTAAAAAQAAGTAADEATAAATTAAERAEEARARAAQLPVLGDIRGDVERAGGPLQATRTAAQAAATPTAVAAALEAAFADAQIALDPAARTALAGDVVARLQATEGWAATDLAAEDLAECTVQPLAKVLSGGGAGHQLLYTHPSRGLVKVTAVLAGVAPDPAGG